MSDPITTNKLPHTPIQITYQFQLIARCPTDHQPDLYHVTVESGHTILCEDLVVAAKEIGTYEEHQPQETITVTLARRFAAKVTTVGWHYGVRTEVVA